MKGTIKWYDEAKGYGFIQTEEGKDIFMHRSGISQPYGGMEAGQRVSFETKEGDRGLIAINVESDL